MGVESYTGQNFDVDIPICVVGAGACGLTAAISAAKEGAKAVIFERDHAPGGSTAMTIGLICAAGTKQQSTCGVDDNADLLFGDIMKATNGETDTELARLLADESGPAMDWLSEAAGCDFHLQTDWRGYGHSRLRCHSTPDGTGEEIIAMLMENAAAEDVDIITQATVRDLIVDPESRIRGIVCDTPEGDLSVGCDALILGSSGFGANIDLVRRFIPDMANAAYHGSANHRGDAMIWGEALGAKLADMGSYQGVGTHTSFGFGLPHAIMMDGGFKVNANGERFENELDNLSGQAVALMAQPGGEAWIVYDHHIHKKTASQFGEYRRNSKLIARACSNNTIDGIAAQAKIDAEGLRETFVEIERAMAENSATSFDRYFSPEQRLVPPFFAVKVSGAIYHTQGGLCIDSSARVERANGSKFPNLFAGGGAARSVSGPAEWGYLPAMGLATAVVFGRIAGREAAKYSLSSYAGQSNAQSHIT